MKSVVVPIKDLKENPNNPRIIKDDAFKKLVQSIKDFPEMIEAREIVVNKDLVILGGNMRFKALKEAGVKEAPIKIVDWSEDKQREFIIKDNVSGGEWDWEMLANEWDSGDLAEWGIDTLFVGGELAGELLDEITEGSTREFSEDVDYDTDKFIRDRINPSIIQSISDNYANGRIREEVYNILIERSKQLTVFNFDELAKFYRSGDATVEEKELLRRLYLVFVAPKELFEDMILKINKKTGDIYDEMLMENGEV